MPFGAVAGQRRHHDAVGQRPGADGQGLEEISHAVFNHCPSAGLLRRANPVQVDNGFCARHNGPALTSALLVVLHLGALHPVEQALTVLLAFGPFVLLGVVIWVRGAGRAGRGGSEAVEPAEAQRER